MLQKNKPLEGLLAKDIMSVNPKTVDDCIFAVDALQIMRNHNITQILVLKNNEYVGVVHLHDILKEGIL
jgi:arabinose-5-phosphate isomerase